jgi:hypothetical protein
MEFAGANPLIPLAPDIDTKLDFSALQGIGQICYTGHLYGDAFPNAEVFLVDPRGKATMLLTFTTDGSPNLGPFNSCRSTIIAIWEVLSTPVFPDSA